MNTVTKKKLTIMLDTQVYEGIKAKVGGRGIGAYLSQLARPHVISDDIEAGYKAMAADKEYNKEASDWIEGVLEADNNENVWH
jgi:hypothetical protein